MTLRDRVKARAQSVLGDGKRIEGQEAEEKTLESPEVTGSKASDMKQTAEVSDDGHEQEENPMPKDGRISVQDGKVTVIPPEAGGRWPVIKPGSNVIVKVNGEVIKEKHTLADGEQVAEKEAVDAILLQDGIHHLPECVGLHSLLASGWGRARNGRFDLEVAVKSDGDLFEGAPGEVHAVGGPGGRGACRHGRENERSQSRQKSGHFPSPFAGMAIQGRPVNSVLSWR